MSFIDIKPIQHIDSHNCLEDIFATIATWYNRNYQLIFKGSWGFVYFPRKFGEGILGNRIDIGDYKIWEYFEQYHGISTHAGFNETPEEIIEIIKRELSENHPVILHVDPYYVEWLEVYRKIHGQHSFLVVGIDNGIICLDPYVNTKHNIMKMDDFFVSEPKYTSISIIGPENFSNVYLLMFESIKELREDLEPINSFKSMKIFAKDVLEKMNIQKEIKGFDGMEFLSPLVRTLHKIGCGRGNYSEMLALIGEVNNNSMYLDYSKKLNEVKKNWFETIDMLLNSLKDINVKHNILLSERIIKLSEMEEHLANEIYGMFESGDLSYTI